MAQLGVIWADGIWNTAIWNTAIWEQAGGGSDTTPDPFDFQTQSGVPLSSVVTSNFITVSGIDAAADISVTDGEYSVNGGAFTSSSGTVNNGDEVQVRHTSSASYSTETETTLTIGGVNGAFSSFTLSDPADSTSIGFGAGLLANINRKKGRKAKRRFGTPMRRTKS